VNSYISPSEFDSDYLGHGRIGTPLARGQEDDCSATFVKDDIELLTRDDVHHTTKRPWGDAGQGVNSF